MSLIAYRYCLPAILFDCLSTKGPFMEKNHTRLTVIGTKQLGQVPGSALEAMSCLSILIFSWLGIFGSQYSCMFTSFFSSPTEMALSYVF